MTVGEFLSGVGRGAKGAALSTWDGLKAAGQAGWDIVSDAPGAREQFWASTKGVAQAVRAYGEQAYEDPAMVWRDAKEQVGAAWTAGKDFAQNADAGQWGEAVGAGGFTVATAVTGAGAAAKGAQLAGKGAKWAGKAAKAQKRADKAPDAGCGAVVPCSKSVKSAEQAADAAKASGRTSGAAAELRVADRVFTDVSTGGHSRSVHPEVQAALEKVPPANRAPWHGHCAEIGCLTQALGAGVNPAGGVSRAVNIGTSGKGHGTLKPTCRSCRSVLDQFGVEHD